MTYLRHLDAEARKAVQAAKKKAAQDSKASRLARARLALETKEAQFRKPRERDNGHLQYVRRAPCIACQILGERQTTPTRAAHIRCSYPEAGWTHTGKAEKPSDWRTAPLCDIHHTDGPDAQHKANERAWWERLGIYPPDLCAALKAGRAAGTDPAEIIALAAGAAKRPPLQTADIEEESRG